MFINFNEALGGRCDGGSVEKAATAVARTSGASFLLEQLLKLDSIFPGDDVAQAAARFTDALKGRSDSVSVERAAVEVARAEGANFLAQRLEILALVN